VIKPPLATCLFNHRLLDWCDQALLPVAFA
jgi:hypothetical protein